jgi:predicted ATP-grasp superfamily ATP-dependent carboligase
MTTVLVLDGRQRSALAAVRSLGRRGLHVLVADSAPRTLAGASRHASSELVYPDPASRPEEFVQWVAATASRMQVRAILPLTDLSVMLLAPARERFSTASLLCAPTAPYEEVSDKARLLQLAGQAGLAVPTTAIATSREELHALLHQREYPLVLKPARSKVLLQGKVLSTEVCLAHTRAEALVYIESVPWVGSLPCLVQEFIPGRGAGVFALYSDGRPIAWFAHRRLREKPPDGGVSVFSESARLDEALKEASARLLSHAEWEGPAMVEYRVTPEGRPYLMEVNGRLWGSVQLAIDCGVDFPWLMYQSAAQGGTGEPPDYLVGRRLRWTLGDLDSLLIQLRRGGSAGRLRALARFLGTFADFRARPEIFRWSDPSPSVRELAMWVKAAL